MVFEKIWVWYGNMKFIITFDSYIMKDDTLELIADSENEAIELYRGWLKDRGMDLKTKFKIHSFYDGAKGINEIMKYLPTLLAGSKSLNDLIHDPNLEEAINAVEKYFKKD